MGKINLKGTLDPESREKVVEQKSLESREKVAEAPIQKRKTSDAQLKATKKWNEKQYRMTLRISPELKVELDRCAMVKGISATKFIEQAIKEQIKRDNAE